MVLKQPSSTSPQDFNVPRKIGTIIIIVVSVIIIDQATKMLVVLFLPLYRESGIIVPVLGDFFRLLHLENSAVTFGIGRSLPPLLRRWLFTLLPLAILLWYSYIVIKDETIRGLRMWGAALIIGGGLGNLVDRIFRGGAVVDFLDVKFYGFLGLERWPVFNMADTAISLGVVLFIIGMIKTRKQHE